MSNDQGHGKPLLNIDDFDTSDDFMFIQRIGIDLTERETELFNWLPDFHRKYLNAIHKRHEIKAAMYHMAKPDKEITHRWNAYFSARDRITERMKVKDVTALVYPILSNHCLRLPGIFTDEVAKAIKNGDVIADNLPRAGLFMDLTAPDEEQSRFLLGMKKRMDSFPYIIVELEQLERIAKEKLFPDIVPVLVIWRKYLQEKHNQNKARVTGLLSKMGFNEELPINTTEKTGYSDATAIYPAQSKSKQKPRKKTMENYKRWHDRLLSIEQECIKSGEKFTENSAHETIAEEENLEVSTIRKGIDTHRKL